MTAHSRLRTSFLAAIMMAASGCIFVGPSGSSGDITFTWTFASRQCFQVADVTQVTVQISGQTLQNSGVFGCTNSGTDGIKLLSFAAGTYPFTISGQDSQGTTIYTASGNVTVDGNVAVAVDLQPTASATGSVYVTWTLPAGTTVTCQYLAGVDIAIDNGSPTPVSCAAGGTSPGVLLQNLSVGTHTIDISARDSTGLFYYRATNSFPVYAGGATTQQFSLAWIVGSAPLAWTFNNGVAQVTCAQAGVTTVGIILRNAQGDTNFTANCTNSGWDGYQVPYVYYGDYQVLLRATGAGGVAYYSSTTAPPTISVVAGQFPSVDGSTPTTLLSL